MIRHPVQFSLGEKEYLKVLQQQFGYTELEAVEHVLAHKRRMADWHEKQGNTALANQLRQEMGE